MLIEYFFIFLIGISIGSFCNVLIYRMPKGLSFITPFSKCPHCNTRLKFYHNIPLLSYIFLKGKCAFCDVKISFSYFLVELLVGILFVCLFYIHYISLEFILIALIFSFLISLAIIDLKYKAIPESLAILVLLMAFYYQITQVIYFDAFILMGFFYTMRLIVSFLLKQESMGEGDIIIAGVIGSILGVSSSVYAVLVACMVAIPFAMILRKRGDLQTPFVPFLTFGLIAVYFYENIYEYIG